MIGRLLFIISSGLIFGTFIYLGIWFLTSLSNPIVWLLILIFVTYIYGVTRKK